MVGGAVSAATGGKFANGAVTSAMSFTLASLNSQDSARYTSGESSEEISVEDARAYFEEAKEALAAVGEDVSNMRFDEGYGYTVNGKGASTSDFDKFQRRAYGKGGTNMLGEYRHETGEIIIYRNALSTIINQVQTSEGTLGWTRIRAVTSIRSGVFVMAHETSHRVYGHNRRDHNFELQTNERAVRKYDQVFNDEE